MSEETKNDNNKKTTSLALDTISQGAEYEDTYNDASTNVSQIHLGQITTSSPPPQVETTKWICEVCTYENFPLSRKCTMCRTGRSSEPRQDGARALPDAEAVLERLKPLRIASPPAHIPPPALPAPPGASATAAVHKWSCATCTYENWPKATKCAMCGASGPSQSIAGTADTEMRRPKRRQPLPNAADRLWLQACLGVVEGDLSRVQAYLGAGGDPARALTASELALLDRNSAFDAGHTLVHLAIRFQREDILAALLSRISGGGPGLKRSPSSVAPDLAAAIRRHVQACIRPNKTGFPCKYLGEFSTFALPAEIAVLPAAVRDQVFSELLDGEAQRTLEDGALINWSRGGSTLHALWNRSCGDCLVDALCQAAYGVADRGGALRAALGESLASAPRALYERWSRWERLVGEAAESGLRAEWSRLAAAAGRRRAPLQQLHVFALAHTLRRPLIVYGVDLVHSFRGEPLGYARFRGVYLPLLWESRFCSKSPLCLGYTRGHFSALVPLEPTPRGRDELASLEDEECAYLPLTDAEGELLPVHFLTAEETGSEAQLVRRWLSCVESRGQLLARQVHGRRALLQEQMVEEWLNHYRRLAQQHQARGPFPRPHPRHVSPAECSSDNENDPDSDQE